MAAVLCTGFLGAGSAAYADSTVTFKPTVVAAPSQRQPMMGLLIAPCSGGSYCAAWIAATAAAVAATAAVVQAATAVAALADSSSSSSSSSGSIHFAPPTKAEAAAMHAKYVAFTEHDFDR
jgi:hypothetical protein